MIKSYFSDPVLYYMSYGLFSFSNGLFNIFVNIMFFSDHNIINVIEFQISMQFTQLLLFIISTYFIKYISAKFLYSSGAILRSLVIASLFLNNFLSSNAILFGFLYGIPSGIFWAGNATFTLQISRKTKRFKFLSVNSALSGITSLIAPLAGGFLIAYSSYAGIYKYFNDFILSSILLIFTGISALFINSSGEKGGIFKISETEISENNYNVFRLFFFSSYIMSIIMSTVLPVYIFLISNSYIIAGLYGTIIAVTSLISNSMAPFLYYRIKKFVLIAFSVIIFASFTFIFKNIDNIFIIFIASSSIMFFLTPLSNLGMTEFMHYLDQFNVTRQYWINREYYIVAGRLISLSSLIFIADIYSVYETVLLIPIFSISILGFIPVLKKLRKDNYT